jgi:hypothetical protein
MIDESRRRFLKHGAATIASASLIGSVDSVTADSGVDPLVLKGTPDRPISVDYIEKRREAYLREHLKGRSDTLDEVVVGTPSVSEDEFLAGYGLAFENGAPVEFIRPVSALENNGWTAQDNQERGTDAIGAAHASVDSFAARHSEGTVSTSSRAGTEPTWDFMGWIELENQARWTYAPWGNNEQTVVCGKISIKAEVYRGPAKNDGRALWVGKLVAQQWPGHVISSDKLAQTYRNAGLFMSQDWYEGHSEALEMTEFGPKIDKTAEINWSLTLGASKAGPQGGITASYDVPRMRRTNVSENDRSVAHEYGYPSGTLERSSKASRQRVQVENIGEFVMTPPTRHQRTLLGIEMTGEFESIRNGGGFVGPDYPSKQVSVGADVSPLDLA